jgi:putative transcriptional regulator
VKGQILKALEPGRSLILPPSEYPRVRNSAGLRKIIASVLLGALMTVLHAAPALAGMEFAQLSVKKGLFLVASPSLEDPNFRQAVVLIVEYGPNGTLGLILNRSTKTLLSDVLPEVAALKGTTHRVFSGGPVDPSNLLVLFRLMEPYADARSVFDGVYVGGTPRLLERMITQAKPTETFRAFAGSAGWAPRQLEAELLVGAWGVLPADSFSIFDQDPGTLWLDCIGRLQAPRVVRGRSGLSLVLAARAQQTN